MENNVAPRAPLINPGYERPDWQAIKPRRIGLAWLDKNENLDTELLNVTTRVLSDLDPLTLASYPECGGLYRKLSNWLDLAPDFILLTPGSDGSIRLTFEAFVNESDLVVHTVPTFAMYSVYSKMFGAQVAPLVYDRGVSGPQLSVEKILSHISRVRPKLFCLPNPDSPTGTVFSPDEIKDIIEQCSEVGAVALIDEAYHPFYQWSCVDWTRDYMNLIVARTFSKAWGLAGLRIGYAVGHPDIIKYMHKLRPMYEVSTISIVFMERMLDFVGEMEASVGRLNSGKSYFMEQMKALGFEVLSTEGNFTLIAFGSKGEAVHRALEDKVLYKNNFQDECLKGYSRFSSSTVDGFKPIVDIIKKAAIDGRNHEP